MRKSRIAWIATDTGSVRTRNEDRCFAGEWSADGDDGAWSVALDAGRWVAAVADGMGGHQAGELASEAAIAALRPLTAGIVSERAAKEAVDRLNEAVFNAMYAPGGRPGMGCTLAALAMDAEQALFFNVGDSRAYVVRGRDIVQHSLDHTARGGGAHARSHILTQSLGGTSRRTPLTPHISRARLADADIVILCSDGLTDMLSEEDIVDVLQRRPPHPARALAEAAIDAGGHDNVTVIVIDAAG